MRQLIVALGICLALLGVCTGWSTSAIEITDAAVVAPQGLVVAQLADEAPTPRCAASHRHHDKNREANGASQRSLASFVAALSPAQRSALVATLVETYRQSADARISGVAQRMLGYLLRERLCLGTE